MQFVDSYEALGRTTVDAMRQTGFEEPVNHETVPENLRTNIEAKLQPYLQFGSSKFEYWDSGLAKQFVVDFGRSDLTLKSTNGGEPTAYDYSLLKAGDTQGHHDQALSKLAPFCLSHQQEVWSKNNPGKTPGPEDEEVIKKLAKNEMKMISQIANQSVWADFIKDLYTGKLLSGQPVIGGSTHRTEYNVVADPDGGFHIDTLVELRGGILAPSDGLSKDLSGMVRLDPEESHTTLKMSIAARPETFADSENSQSAPEVRSATYEYQLAPLQTPDLYTDQA